MWLRNKKDPVDDFWQWFTDHSELLLAMKAPHEPTLRKLHAQIKRIDPGLVFEFEVQRSPRAFVVSADGDARLFPTVLEVVKRAPRLPGWQVLAFRQPGPNDVVVEMRGLRLGPSDISFVAQPDNGGVGITLFLRDLRDENKEALGHAAFMLLDNALGEFLVETAVSFIHLKPLAEAPPDATFISGLLPAVTSIMPVASN